jgi:hypothetical protein
MSLNNCPLPGLNTRGEGRERYALLASAPSIIATAFVTP